MGFFDLIMLGDIGKTELAAVGIANAVFFLFFLFCMGILFSVSPLVAITKGENQPYKSIFILRDSIKVALITGSFLFVFFLLATNNFSLLGQSYLVTHLSKSYLNIVNYSVFPMLLFNAGKHYLDGLGRTMPSMVITFIGLALNVFFNWLLIYGNWGFDAMGLEGAAYATLISRIGMAVFLFTYIEFHKITIALKKEASLHKRVAYLKIIFKMGIPIGFQLFFEIASFTLAAVFAGKLGVEALAAHNIALNLSSITYMGATGLAAAGSIMTGNAFGANNKKEIRQAGKTVQILVLCYMLFCATVFIMFRNGLIHLYTNTTDVVTIAIPLLFIAAFFQIPDGLQSVGMGILRGIKDVTFPSFVAFIAYWIIGIPLCYYLGFKTNMGINGIWVGLSAGLTVSAILLNVRFFRFLTTSNYE